jgi:carbon monoxide dehydrogenase subunit G
MHLEFSGSPVVQASRLQVWQRLLDPAFLARSVPGVESIRLLDPTHFRVISRLGIARLKIRFAMEVVLYDIVAGRSAKMHIRGKAPGSAVEVMSSMRVEDTGIGVAQLYWSAAAEVRGAVAGAGSRVLQAFTNRLTTHFWTDFARRVSDPLASDRKVEVLPL